MLIRGYFLSLATIDSTWTMTTGFFYFIFRRDISLVASFQSRTKNFCWLANFEFRYASCKLRGYGLKGIIVKVSCFWSRLVRHATSQPLYLMVRGNLTLFCAKCQCFSDMFSTCSCDSNRFLLNGKVIVELRDCFEMQFIHNCVIYPNKDDELIGVDETSIYFYPVTRSARILYTHTNLRISKRRRRDSAPRTLQEEASIHLDAWPVSDRPAI